MKKAKFMFVACLALLCNGYAQTPSYEQFLDSLEAMAKSLLPGRERLASLKESTSAETPEPKGEYEKQAVYEERAANFEKAKQQKLLKLETDLQAEEKKTVDAISDGIGSKADIQPNWDGMLKFDASAAEYAVRYEKLKAKIPEMKAKIDSVGALLASLGFGGKQAEALAAKNACYISRLERACELMQDYIVQDRARILTSERKKTAMTLGNYDPESEEFQASVSDTSSQTAPFDYSGTIKITPEQAQAINRKTDDFTASVDYINYPFAANGAKVYLGMKKANIFYKDKEMPSSGVFKGIPGYEKLDGYMDWALYADSLLTGKLAPKRWDSLYAMQPKHIESGIASGGNGDGSAADDSPSGTFWTGKNIFRAAMFALSAASLGGGLYHNREAAARTDEANQFLVQGNLDAHRSSADEFENSKKLRNIYWGGAGAFGLAGIISFFF